MVKYINAKAIFYWCVDFQQQFIVRFAHVKKIKPNKIFIKTV